MTSTKPKQRKKKVGSIAEELGALKKQVDENQKANTERFTEGDDKMKTLATKEDTAEILNLLLTDEGEPKFATKQDMQPILDLYKGGTFAKSLLAGVAFTIITISALGYAIISIIGWVRGS